MIRIATGQGPKCDGEGSFLDVLSQGPIDYLILDCLSQTSLGVFQAQKIQNPALGYLKDLPTFIKGLAKEIRKRGVRIITNAGGVNPDACAQKIRQLAPALRVAVIHGDSFQDRLTALIDRGYDFRNIETGNLPADILANIRDRTLTAHVDLGAFPIVNALNAEADIVITGLSSTPSMSLAAMIHAFKWKDDDWDHLSAGVIAGHIAGYRNRCTQCSSDPLRVTVPIIEADPDGCFTITKHSEAPGQINLHAVKEQLLHQIHDPARYFTPDVIADLTSISVREDGKNRVRITGAKGRPRPEQLKVSINYQQNDQFMPEWFALLPRDEVSSHVEVLS